MVSTSSDPSEDDTVAMSNVTAVATQPGPTPYGVYVEASDLNSSKTIVAHNVIAYGLAPDGDVRAIKDTDATAASFEATYSNYDLVSQMGGASITAPRAAGGQAALPQFSNLAGGDVHRPPARRRSTRAHPTSSTSAEPSTSTGTRARSAPPPTSAATSSCPPSPSRTRPHQHQPDQEAEEEGQVEEEAQGAKFAFTSTEAGSSFTCTIDGNDFGCDSGDFAKKVKRGKHKFEVAATDPAGNTDDSPATYSWKLKRKR